MADKNNNEENNNNNNEEKKEKTAAEMRKVRREFVNVNFRTVTVKILPWSLLVSFWQIDKAAMCAQSYVWLNMSLLGTSAYPFLVVKAKFSHNIENTPIYEIKYLWDPS